MKNREQSFHLHHPNEKNAHSPNTATNHNHHSHVDYSELQNKSIGILKIVIFLTFGFAIIEAISGQLFNSLALISDAAHMFTDSSSLLIALIMTYVNKIPADHNHSYCHGRAEVLGALFNGLFMVGVIVYIFYASINKFYERDDKKIY